MEFIVIMGRVVGSEMKVSVRVGCWWCEDLCDNVIYVVFVKLVGVGCGAVAGVFIVWWEWLCRLLR